MLKGRKAWIVEENYSKNFFMTQHTHTHTQKEEKPLNKSLIKKMTT